jgi:transcriptional regulator with GAF, ATPase, and Fis domain
LVGDVEPATYMDQVTAACVDELEGVEAAGVLLAEPGGRGRLRAVGASSVKAHTVEAFQIQTDHGGPCLDAYQTGRMVVATHLGGGARWPEFSLVAIDAGFESVYGIPLQYHGHTLGALNLLCTYPVGIESVALDVAQTFAGLAAAALMVTGLEVRIDGVVAASEGRKAIEVAMGLVMGARVEMDRDAAHEVIRSYARSNKRKMVDVAADMESRTLSVDDVIGRR